MFSERTRAEHVPEIGAGYESATLDMKGGPKAYRQFHDRVETGWKSFEIAKDVAAFANATGGTILIGATEDAGAGVCSAHVPFSDEAAKDLSDAITLAVEQRCRPRPLVDLARIAFPAGVMLAVNVWAFPGQPIAVSVTGNSKQDGHGGVSYVFPIRLFAKTVYLPPEQLAMLMSPDVRRRAIILATVKPGESIHVHPEIRTLDDQHVRPWTAALMRLDEQHGVVVVMHDNAETGLPLDGMSAAWRDDKGVHIVIDRRLFPR